MATALPIQVVRESIWKRHFSFMEGDKKVGALQYEKVFSCKAKGSFRNHEWKFLRKGLWRNRIEIVAQQSPYTKTHIRCSWRRRFEVRAEDGNKYYFKQASFWHSKWVWKDARGEPVMEIKSRRLSGKNRGTITFLQTPQSAHQLLVLLGWYQLLAWEDQARIAG